MPRLPQLLTYQGLSTNKHISYQEVSCDILGSIKFLTLKSLVGKAVYLSDGGGSRIVAKTGIAEILFDEEPDLMEGDMMFSSCE